MSTNIFISHTYLISYHSYGFFSLSVLDHSYRFTSPLSTPTILLPPNGAVEMAQPIRTMPIITEQETQASPNSEEVHDGVEESEEVQEEQHSEEFSHVVEALEVEENLEQQMASLGTMESRSRSSSITSWESAQGMFSTTEASELSSSRYSTITQEDFQQELVVKAIKLKKKGKRRRHGKSISIT